MLCRCVGARTLTALLANYSRNRDIKTAIRVGVVGLPNVGKSSLINSLKRSRACGVGAVPGMASLAFYSPQRISRNVSHLPVCLLLLSRCDIGQSSQARLQKPFDTKIGGEKGKDTILKLYLDL